MALGRTTVLLLASLVIVGLVKQAWVQQEVRHALVKRSVSCDEVLAQPFGEQCAFALAHCSGATPGLFDYITTYYCASAVGRVFFFALMCVWLLFLFGFVGIAASDFFCPNLQTIATMLHLPETLTGVTFLALGNGSPDLFSTFSAMQADLGSLALGELIGAASFIVSIVAGTMCVVKPFRAVKHSFLRDVTFFMLAVVTVVAIAHDGHIHLYEAILLIALYLVYVVVVVAGTYIMNRRSHHLQLMQRARAEYEDTGADVEQLLQSEESDNEMDDELYSYDESLDPDAAAQKFRIRTSLFSAMEFQDVVQSLRKVRGRRKRQHQRHTEPAEPSPVQNVVLTTLDGHEESEVPLRSPPSPSPSSWLFRAAPSRRRWWRDQLVTHLFPSLRHWHEKKRFSKGTAVVSVPALFLLVATLPVVQPHAIKHIALADKDTHHHAPENDLMDLPDDDDDDAFIEDDEDDMLDGSLAHAGSWCRWLTAMHCVTSPLLLHLILMREGVFSAVFIPVTLGVGALVACALLATTSDNHQPRLYWMMAFTGFVMAVAWIFIIANEVVSVLRTVGMAIGVSEAILGLTIFALGNSLGDFVANVTMARLGYPLMAMSACYGGPLLNLLLGIGLGVTMVIWQRQQPYEIHMSPTILVSAVSLLIVLLSSLVLVPLNNYRMTRRIGYFWIAIYLITIVINIVVEVTL